MRIGHGYDVHAFGDGDHIMLCGVRIAHQNGLMAHSDGDVALHALTDAFLGALALGDIGHHFPDDDTTFEGADSRQLLRQVVALVKARGFALGNADLTIIAQAPKLASHIAAMRQNLSEDLGGDIDQINVKATTTERLGFVGREEGISVHAVVLLKESPSQ
jgi:2-C-methyl-D-erythritol 2,4-cyclodiphosphate synthase